MKHDIIKVVLLATSLLFSASLAFAAENTGAAPGDAKAAAKSQSNTKSAGAAKQAAAKVKLVDINGAGKKELQTLPGISEADADKIIAGRPYGSKAHLTTRNIVSREVYENLKTLVIAKQKQTVAAKQGGK